MTRTPPILQNGKKIGKVMVPGKKTVVFIEWCSVGFSLREEKRKPVDAGGTYKSRKCPTHPVPTRFEL
eukprot:1366005-Rhodomonas_salina.1